MLMKFGMNIVRNLGMLGFAMTMPVSSELSYRLLQTKAWLPLAGVAATSVAFAALCVIALVRVDRNRAAVAVVAVLSVVSLFPHALLGKVGELYAYNGMPYFSVLVGVGLGQLILNLRHRKPAFAVLAVVLCALLVSHLVAVRSKTEQVKSNGLKSAALMAQIESFAAEVSPNGRIWIRVPDPAEPGYSIYRMPGLGSLPWNWLRIPGFVKRPDLAIRPISPQDLARSLPTPDTLILALEGDRLVRWSGR
jgi:hypothetical protein